jgi:hypothetical protein
VDGSASPAGNLHSVNIGHGTFSDFGCHSLFLNDDSSVLSFVIFVI